MMTEEERGSVHLATQQQRLQVVIVDPLRQKMVVDVDLSTLDLRQKLSCYNREIMVSKMCLFL